MAPKMVTWPLRIESPYSPRTTSLWIHKHVPLRLLDITHLSRSYHDPKGAIVESFCISFA
jgi:hypothetical protein